MNETVYNFLLARYKFMSKMSKMHLRQHGFTHSACGPFIKRKKEYLNLKKQEIHNIFIERS